jgi:hypothetical protein
VGEDGGLIAGHARVLAARQLGIAEIPVMVARAVHLITQSVCMGLVYRAMYSISEIPSTASSRLLSVVRREVEDHLWVERGHGCRGLAQKSRPRTVRGALSRE